MSANFRDIPANFRDIPANFRDICVLFFVSTRNMLQTCFQLLWEFSSGISPNFLGLPFSYLQPRLPFSYYVMERAAKACEEPENTWNDQKLRYFKFSSLSHPGSSKSRFCWISLFFLALRAPQVAPKLRKCADKSISQPWCSHSNTIYEIQPQKTIVLRMQPRHQATLMQPLQCDLQRLSCKTQ